MFIVFNTYMQPYLQSPPTWWLSTSSVLQQVLQVSEVEIDEMFDVADTDRDGIIGFPEFMVMIRAGTKRIGMMRAMDIPMKMTFTTGN